jgi:hypothetical protein
MQSQPDSQTDESIVSVGSELHKVSWGNRSGAKIIRHFPPSPNPDQKATRRPFDVSS